MTILRRSRGSGCFRRFNLTRGAAKILRCFCLTIYFLSSTSNAHTQEQVVAIDGGDPRFYTTHASIECGGRRVLIDSECFHFKDSSMRYCYAQNVAFFNPKTNDVSILTYRHPRRDVSENFIYKMSCINANSNYYVIIGNTNFGSCNTCEWDDVYYVGGKYAGTNTDAVQDDLERDRPVRKKALDKAFEAFIYGQPGAKSLDSVEISRAEK